MEARTIYELFPELPESEVREAFRRQAVEIPEGFRFARVNLVTGSNGSGKTRFLRALKSLSEKQDRGSVIYGYFPALSDRPVRETDEEEPPVTLFESISSGDIDFEDFFHEIERHNGEFIQELLLYRSKRRTEIQGLVAESFRALTGRELVFQEKQAFLRKADGETEPLSELLDKLSPGELILFYMSIFLALRKDGAQGKIILLDEPESHLHPKALRAFVRLLTEQYGRASIWIATHSLFLVPAFQFENMVYIKDSAVQKRGGGMYRAILGELLGHDRATEDFFASSSQWQFCQFLAECFADPAVVDTVNPEDEQVRLFMEHLHEKTPMRVLDWGGGSARLGESLLAAGYRQGTDMDYHIYDWQPRYSGQDFAVFRQLEDIRGPYDCIVMMNFLHEVEPADWPDIFKRAFGLLEPDGFLLFIEVKALRDGEMPNRTGYLLLGPEEARELFPGGEAFRVSVKKKSVGVLVPREALNSITDGSVLQSLRRLRKRALQEIKQLRAGEGFPKPPEEIRALEEPRHYAFAVQQYINAMLAAAEDEEALLAENMRLDGSLKAALAEKAGLEEQYRKLEEQKETLTQVNDVIQDTLDGLDAEKKRLAERCRELETSERGLTARGRYLEERLSWLEEEKKGLEEQCRELEESKQNLTAKSEALEKSVSSLEEEKKNLEKQHTSLQAREQNMGMAAIMLQTSLKKLQEEKKGLEEQCRKLEESKQKLTAKSEAREKFLSRLADEKEDMKSRCLKLEESERILTERNAVLTRNLFQLKEDKKSLEEQCRELTEQNAALTERQSGLEGEKETLAAEFRRLEVERKGLEAKWILDKIKLLYMGDDPAVRDCIREFSLAVKRFLQEGKISKRQYAALLNNSGKIDMKQAVYPIEQKSLLAWFSMILVLIGE